MAETDGFGHEIAPWNPGRKEQFTWRNEFGDDDPRIPDAAFAEAERRIQLALGATGPDAEGPVDLNFRSFELNALPPSLFKLGSRLRRLDLGASYFEPENHFVALPAGHWGGFDTLTYLDLSRCGLSQLPTGFSTLQNLKTLDLSNNQLDSLPEDFSTLQNLSTLNLRSNQLNSLPEDFSTLQNLSTLDLSNNQLNSLPEDFSTLQNLSTLDLKSNQLNSLPEDFSTLQNLSTLDLRSNQLNSLPEDFSTLQNLSRLYLSNNQLASLPKDFATLQKLSGLNLRSNQLNSLPEDFSTLQNLSTLDLSNNQLNSLPEDFSTLQNLSTLDLGNNQLDSLPKDFATLQKLSYIDLSNNQLDSLPEGFATLQKLSTLYLSNNQLDSLPKDFSTLQKLSTLDLSNNRLDSLPEDFSTLQNLSRLYFSNNQLNSLPEDFSTLQNLSTLHLKGNPNLGPALLSAAREGVTSLFRYLEAEKADVVEGKLIFIGPPKVGKSSLLAALNDEPIIQERPQTHPLERKTITLGTARFNAWDFGGQVEYRGTQQLFYSRGVYVAMWNPRDRDGTFDRLVERLELVMSQISPEEAIVFIVASYKGNCEDAVISHGEEARLRKILNTALPGETTVAFHHVNSMGAVKNEDGTIRILEREGVADLRETLIRETVDSGFVSLKFEKKWASLLHDASDWEELYLDWEEYTGRVRQYEGLDDQDARDFASRMYYMGRWAFYDENTHAAGGQNLIVLRPEWITRAAAEIINEKSVIDEFGVVCFEHFREIVAEDSMDGVAPYPWETHPHLLRMLMQSDFCWMLNGDRGGLSGPQPEDRIVFPQLLGEEEPEDLPGGWELAESDHVWTVAYQLIDGGRNPIDLVDEIGLSWRLAVRLRGMDLDDQSATIDPDRFKAWKYGVYRDLGDGREVLATFSSEVKGGPRTLLKLAYRGRKPVEWEPWIRNELIQLKNELAKEAEIKRFVSCVHVCEAGGERRGCGLFKLKAVETAAQNPRGDFYCDFCDDVVSAPQLLQQRPPELDRMRDEILHGIDSKFDEKFQDFEKLLTGEMRVVREGLNNIDEQIDGLSEQNRKLMRQLLNTQGTICNEIEGLARFLNDVAKDGPRFILVREAGKSRLGTGRKYEVILHCEHCGMMVNGLEKLQRPSLNTTVGIYPIHIEAEWFNRAQSFFKLMSTVLQAVVTGAMNKYPELASVSDESAFAFALGRTVGGRATRGGSPGNWKLENNDRDALSGPELRKIHELLNTREINAKADGFGGLVRVRVKTPSEDKGRARWVHPMFLKAKDQESGENLYEEW